MFSVSDTYLREIISDTRDMPYRVKLAGAVLLSQTQIPKMSLSESVSGNSGISIGTSNSATLSLTLRDADAIDYTDVLVEPESGLTLPDGTIEWVPLGKFWVTNFSTSNDYRTVSLTCSDGMYLLSGEYVSKLTYPASIEAVTHELVAMSGVDFAEPDEWPDVVVRKRPENLTYREAFGYAAGCCGSNARFNREGLLEFVWYTDIGVTIERNTQYLDGMTKLHNKPLKVNFEVTGKKETYNINIVSDGNGGVVATPGASVLEGETITLSINPFSRHELATLEAHTATGEPITLYMEAEGSGYTFIQPDSDVTVTASFRESSAGPFKFTLRAYDNGAVAYDSSLNEAGSDYFNKGDTVKFYVYPDNGYELDKFVTTPSRLNLSTVDGRAYSFVMPQSDVTINAHFKEETEYYAVECNADSGGSVFAKNTSGAIIETAAEGETVTVVFSPDTNYALDYYDSTVKLTQVGTNTYTFIMPAKAVYINAHYKEADDGNKVGAYSWLQTPQAAPTTKPYWAVFYNENDFLPTCQKYYLVWFDSWEAISYSYEQYTIRLNGYYYCGGKNNGHGNHEWDTSTWKGNGASALEWDVRIDRLYADWDDYYGPSEQYCLLASNAHLYYRGEIVFEKCENSIQSPQISYLKDGMDVREQGSLTQWLCPDSFSTPAPASNWLVLMPESGLYMTVGEDGKYDTPITPYPKSLIAFYYDDISIQNIGAIFDDTDEELYIASFTNARWTYLRDLNLGWDEEIHELPEGAVIGFRSPLVSTASADGYLNGDSYNFAGVLVTSRTLYDTNGNLFMYKNSCRICDCGTPKATFKMLARRSIGVSTENDAIVIESEGMSVSTNGSAIVINSNTIEVSTDGKSIVMTIGEEADDVDADEITLSYSNPMIYEKAVGAVSAQLRNLIYTPAKVKHRGNPAFQAGDIVRVPDGNGVYHAVLIMQQKMNFGGGMNAEITCPGQSDRASDFSANGPITTQIKKEVQAQNLELEHRVNANNSLVFASIYKSISSSEAKIANVVERQTANEATIAKIEQTANKNSAKISLVVGQNAIVNEDGAVQGGIVIQAINGETKAKISADRLDIEGKELNIKVNATNIVGKFTVLDDENREIFSAGEKIVRLGGWDVDENSIRIGTLGAAGSMWLCRNGTKTAATIGTSGDINGWCIAVADKFGVTKEGVLFGKDVNLSGEINATTGAFGNWSIGKTEDGLDSITTTDGNGTVHLTAFGVIYYPEGANYSMMKTWGQLLGG